MGRYRTVPECVMCSRAMRPSGNANTIVATNDNSTAAELATDDTKSNISASKNSDQSAFSENQFSFITLNETVSGEGAEVKNDIIERIEKYSNKDKSQKESQTRILIPPTREYIYLTEEENKSLTEILVERLVEIFWLYLAVELSSSE